MPNTQPFEQSADDLLQTLWNSCEEGAVGCDTDGARGWVPASDANGFRAMQFQLERLASFLNLIPPEAYTGDMDLYDPEAEETP